ncbi:leucine-rich repeat-containing protein kinase family protein [Pseudomonas sp. CBSPBW29]|uniref:leucine-rich repeat-containing protein kinase family protein n=1 Tax=Pseudomonas TaxID=286 RepID=UPI0021ABCB84|nr:MULTISPECIES: leucine-rich repeat-containing protein kinase family protein [unclassified Pseudomonas]WEL42486.1 leucine-rich repeat-containing protein kinase family protein [Pseudomonas sp. CBSPBW29]WEL63549.1 leucine-rich repeat-containing protein kinase family protein [Pseudomonas sp. CBSPGW29]WEL72739.1 leucine-rich repeat-containing protein kinase family protein [Pseudomonas sp. CBSPCGW29]WEL74052.1 leucine-rich repeat-containing protein kinase family protein [Pseudomonas sp. CBSPAW29]W
MDTLAQLKAGQLAGIKRLDLRCGLTEFPREIFDLADSLEILNLTGNALSSLPDDLHRLPHLRVLFCSENAFTEVPECLGQCAQLSMIGFKSNQISSVPAASLPPLLRWLILTDNRISQLPSELGERPLLQKLMLAGNQLEQLPPSLAQCKNLELIRIASNRLTRLPDWLLTLPSLTWLAYAGNPVEMAVEEARHDATPNIPWSELELGEVLGEGASGIIRKAFWTPPTAPAKAVAVKLYKGSITSDGSPLHEMHACIAAGLHANLIKVEGRVVDHPEGQAALVMQLIEPSYRNLAALPSLASCTRDIYEPTTRFSADVALRMARGIASVAAHLHAQGITHGDLYGHNILWNEAGACLLGDFGAASFHATVDSQETRALQRIEVRAFGVLLGELLERIDTGLSEEKHVALEALRDNCCQPDVLARPEFEEITSLLQSSKLR